VGDENSEILLSSGEEQQKTEASQCINVNMADDSSNGQQQEDLEKEKTSQIPGYVINGDELLRREVAEMPTLLKPFLQKVGLALLAGSSDTGKSAWLRQLAAAIVLGLPEFLGLELTASHNSAIYVSTEDDANSVAYLLQKQNSEGVAAEKFKRLRFIFEVEGLLKRLDEELSRAPADVVVIDTLTDVFDAGDFNSAVVVKSFLQRYRSLALKHQCLIIFNHHLSKSKEFGIPSKTSILGSSGIEALARMLLELRKDRFDNSLRHLVPLKGNYVPPEVKERSMVLKFDENMLFFNTGKFTAIEELAGHRSVNSSAEMKERAAELKKQGKSVREIAKNLVEDFGVPIGKTTVAEWLRAGTNGKTVEQSDKESPQS
jgi:archaellum biogenesis ATPase FlaH